MMNPVRIVRRLAVNAVGAGLFASGWVLLGVFAVGNKVFTPIERSRVKDDYV